MIRMDRTKKLERILLAAGIILLLIAGGSFLRATGPVSSNAFREAQTILITMWGSFALAVIAFLAALILHVIRKDLEEELR